jgi:hypothetical protein
MYERSKHLEPDANHHSGSLLSSNFGTHSQRGLGTGTQKFQPPGAFTNGGFGF